MELNTNIYPKEGYFFTDTDRTVIRGTSWAAVERNVRKYRERRGVAIGDIHAEVVQQVCERQPSLCRGVAVANKNPVVKSKKVSLKARVFEWLARFARLARQGPLDYVTEREARERAAICKACPKQQVISGVCSQCADSRMLLRKAILAGRRPVGELEACGVLGTDLETAVYLAEPPEILVDLPENCWRRNK